MKRVFIFVSLLLFISLFSLAIISSADIGKIQDDLDAHIENVEDAKNKIDDLKETEWDYLGKEWQTILLKNKAVSSFDSILKKISFLFEVFFGMPYSLSLTLLGVIILWFFFFLKFNQILGDYGILQSHFPLVAAIGLSIGAAQIGIFKGIVEFLGWLIFTQEAVWLSILIFVAIIFGGVIASKFSSALGDSYQATQEQIAVEQAKADRGIIRNFADSIMKGFKK